MATKAIKGVDEGKWAEFKAIAASRDVSMGELFNEAVDAITKEKSGSQLDEILEAASNIKHTEKEWNEIEQKTKEFRKSFKMRNFSEIRP